MKFVLGVVAALAVACGAQETTVLNVETAKLNFNNATDPAHSFRFLNKSEESTNRGLFHWVIGHLLPMPPLGSAAGDLAETPETTVLNVETSKLNFDNATDPAHSFRFLNKSEESTNRGLFHWVLGHLLPMPPLGSAAGDLAETPETTVLNVETAKLNFDNATDPAHSFRFLNKSEESTNRGLFHWVLGHLLPMPPLGSAAGDLAETPETTVLNVETAKLNFDNATDPAHSFRFLNKSEESTNRGLFHWVIGHILPMPPLGSAAGDLAEENLNATESSNRGGSIFHWLIGKVLPMPPLGSAPGLEE